MYLTSPGFPDSSYISCHSTWSGHSWVRWEDSEDVQVRFMCL